MASLEKEELAKGRQGQGLAKKDAASQQQERGLVQSPSSPVFPKENSISKSSRASFTKNAQKLLSGKEPWTLSSSKTSTRDLAKKGASSLESVQKLPATRRDKVDEATLALSSPSPASFSRRIGSPPATLKRSPLLKDTKSSVPAASAIQGPRPVVTSPLKGVASVPSPRAHSKAQGALAHKASSLQAPEPAAKSPAARSAVFSPTKGKGSVTSDYGQVKSGRGAFPSTSINRQADDEAAAHAPQSPPFGHLLAPVRTSSNALGRPKSPSVIKDGLVPTALSSAVMQTNSSPLKIAPNPQQTLLRKSTSPELEIPKVDLAYQELWDMEVALEELQWSVESAKEKGAPECDKMFEALAKMQDRASAIWTALSDGESGTSSNKMVPSAVGAHRPEPPTTPDTRQAALEDKLAAAQKEVAAAKAHASKLAALQKEWEAELVAAKAHAAQQEEKLAAAREELASPSKQLARTRAELTTAEGELAALEEKLVSPRKELASVQEQLVSAQTKLSAAQAKLAAAEKKEDKEREEEGSKSTGKLCVKVKSPPPAEAKAGREVVALRAEVVRLTKKVDKLQVENNRMTTQANMDMSWFGEQLQKGRDELQADINTALGRTTQLEKALGHEQKARMELEVRLEKNLDSVD